MAAADNWNRNGSFMKKPLNGWLHEDSALENGDGVYYPVKYIGSIPLNVSMTELTFPDRTDVTREAIAQLCEAAGLRTNKKRKVSAIAKKAITSRPNVFNANVKLTICIVGIALVDVGTNEIIANHIMPNVSFATGGDNIDYDVIGYVAKDAQNVREAHIFHCGDLAPDIMATIGQAFELRYKAYLRKLSTGQSFPQDGAEVYMQPTSAADRVYDQAAVDSIYDAPGAPSKYGAAGSGYGLPSDDGGYMGITEQVIYDNKASTGYDNTNSRGSVKSSASYLSKGQVTYDQAGNEDSGYGLLPGYGVEFDAGHDDPVEVMPAPGGRELEKPLNEEPWFHGMLRRDIANMLLKKDGDFLVRENLSCPNQFILSAMSHGQKRHMLLVDPAGRVRTKDMGFRGVSHLINYHLRARIAVSVRGSSVVLAHAIAKSGSASNYEF
eukprot:m.162950 g.162950  ORF g.162950 m.162950 type:complete len:438 (+) comp17102_c0_seq1:141-1454(+)